MNKIENIILRKTLFLSHKANVHESYRIIFRHISYTSYMSEYSERQQIMTAVYILTGIR